MHSSFRNIDPFLIIEGGRDSILPICNGSDSKKLWEMWPKKAWNSLEAEGTLFLTHNLPFMSSSEIGLNILTWNC